MTFYKKSGIYITMALHKHVDVDTPIPYELTEPVSDVLPLTHEQLLDQLDLMLSGNRAGSLAIGALRTRISEMQKQHRSELAEKDQLLTIDTRSGVGTLVAEQEMFGKYEKLFGEIHANRRETSSDMPWGILVVHIDLINFGAINVNYTHEAGNKAISLVGDQLNGIKRPEDTVIRDGGDEFRLYFELHGSVDPDTLAKDKMRDLQANILREQENSLSYLPDIRLRYAYDTWTPDTVQSLSEFKKSVDAKVLDLQPDLN